MRGILMLLPDFKVLNEEALKRSLRLQPENAADRTLKWCADDIIVGNH